MRRLSVTICLVGALTLGVACGGGASEPAATPTTRATPASGSSPTATPTTIATPTVPATPAGGSAGEPGLTFAFPDEVSGGTIRDYRVRTSSRITVEGENVPPDLAAGTFLWDFSMDVVLDPAARHIVMHVSPSSAGLPFTQGQDRLEVIQIEDTSWIKIGGTWSQMTLPSDQVNQTLYFKDLLPSMPSWERVGTETVNGFSTTHYRAQVSSSELAALSASLFASGLLGAGREFTDVVLESFTYDTYVTDDGLIVRTVAKWVAEARLDGQPVTLTLESIYDVEGVNLGITIAPPQVETPAAEVPLPAGATHKETLLGIVTYVVSGMTVDEVVAFYQEALPAGGFTIGMASTQPGEGGVIEARKDGKSYFITIGLEDGEVTVTVMGGRQ